MRKLASVEVIDKLEPIPNADRILKATVKGWECVVSKSDNFQVGDKIIYIEVDSILPARPEFSFLKERKYRVRTIKLRKQISQGLILPLSYLKGNYEAGDDVTKELGIKKYDPQAEAEKEKRIREAEGQAEAQNLPTLFKKLQVDKTPLTATEKIDGQSGTFFYCDGKFGVCSRNIWLRKEDNSAYWEVARRFQLEETVRALKNELSAKKVVIQGEIIGQGIQENKYKISGYDFYVFNIIIDGIKLDQNALEILCKKHNLKVVPTILKDYVIPQSFEIHDLVNVAKGKSKLLDTQDREGLVFRNYDENISFKAISPDFLLKEI